MTLPNKLQEIVDDFASMSREEKLETLIAYAESMPDLPERFQDERSKMEAVPECMTPVYVQAETRDGRMNFYFDVPAESPTVRGYAAIMEEGVRESTPQQVLSIPGDFYRQMGLDQVLTPQRLNGMAAILAHMKRLAVEALKS